MVLVVNERRGSSDELQRELEHKLRNDLELHRELQRKLGNDVEIARKALETYGPALQAAITTARQVIEMQPDSAYLRTIQLASEAVAFTKSLAETRSLERELLPQLAARGWLISPLADADTPRELHQAFIRGGIASAEAELIAMMDADACRAVADDLATRPSYAQWSPTFAKALRAHLQGDHELAIPIWLAALDGISNQELGVEAYSIQNVGRKRRTIKRKILPRLSPVYEPIADAWLDVLSGFSIAPKPTTPALVNRNAVVHG
jgi:hypothetical protein